MYSFVRVLRKEQHTRRYSIEVTGSGWEVREEQDQEVLRRSHYQDWHRVERAWRGFTLVVNGLREDGWHDVQADAQLRDVRQ